MPTRRHFTLGCLAVAESLAPARLDGFSVNVDLAGKSMIRSTIQFVYRSFCRERHSRIRPTSVLTRFIGSSTAEVICSCGIITNPELELRIGKLVITSAFYLALMRQSPRFSFWAAASFRTSQTDDKRSRSDTDSDDSHNLHNSP